MHAQLGVAKFTCTFLNVKKGVSSGRSTFSAGCIVLGAVVSAHCKLFRCKLLEEAGVLTAGKGKHLRLCQNCLWLREGLLCCFIAAEISRALSCSIRIGMYHLICALKFVSTQSLEQKSNFTTGSSQILVIFSLSF
jgi:hypothetical protein